MTKKRKKIFYMILKSLNNFFSIFLTIEKNFNPQSLNIDKWLSNLQLNRLKVTEKYFFTFFLFFRRIFPKWVSVSQTVLEFAQLKRFESLWIFFFIFSDFFLFILFFRDFSFTFEFLIFKNEITRNGIKM